MSLVLNNWAQIYIETNPGWLELILTRTDSVRAIGLKLFYLHYNIQIRNNKLHL